MIMIVKDMLSETDITEQRNVMFEMYDFDNIY